jgi:hypothetical protein
LEQEFSYVFAPQVDQLALSVMKWETQIFSIPDLARAERAEEARSHLTNKEKSSKQLS